VYIFLLLVSQTKRESDGLLHVYGQKPPNISLASLALAITCLVLQASVVKGVDLEANAVNGEAIVT